MEGAQLAPDTKRTSVLRRLPPLESASCVAVAGLEGDVCPFGLPAEASPIGVGDVSGRSLVLAPGDIFLATPGHREPTRCLLRGVPTAGFVPTGRSRVFAQA